MSILLFSPPNPTPATGLENYERQNAYITATLQAFTGRAIVDGTTIRGGTIIKIGDVIYKATSDTAISGSQSDYVKITPSGGSATASFVADLSGVSWSHAHGQYLDGSGNLYVFDEAKAVSLGAISTPYTLLGKLSRTAGGLVLNGALSGVSDLSMTGALTGMTNVPEHADAYTYTHEGASANLYLPDIAVNQRKFFSIRATLNGLGTITLRLPSTGTHDYILSSSASSGLTAAGGATIASFSSSSSSGASALYHGYYIRRS